ncbi:unnamed protein product, partial [Rotaria sp. Silwood1]
MISTIQNYTIQINTTQ